MKQLYSIICICFTLSVSAQYNNDFLFFSLNKRSLNFNTEYEINSNAINNSFINRFYTGGYIDGKMKDNVNKNLHGYNRIGGYFNYNMVGFFGKDTSKYRFAVGVKQQQLFNSGFSRDFFKLGFYGNKIYEGGTANLSNTSINFYSFQEFKVGLISTEVDTNHASMGISISYLKGQNLQQLSTNTTSVYTANDASQVSLTTNATFSMSDTSKTGLNAITGNGASADFFAETPYVSKLGKSKFFLCVNNLGFIRWNKNSMNYTTDSTFIFSGIKVNNLFDIKDSVLKSIKADSIINNTTEFSRHYVSTNLPTSFFITHKIEFSSWYSFTNGFRNVFHANYKPYIFIENEFKFSKNVFLTFHLGYGGYGKLNAGIYSIFKIADKIQVRIGSNSIQGFLSPKNTLGQGAYFSLSYHID